MNKRTRLWFAAVEGHDLAKVRAQLEGGVPVDLLRPDGRTALMTAALTRNTAMAELLLAHGANISLEDNAGRNALHYLLAPVYIVIPAFADEDFEATATLLLAAGAAPDRVSYRTLAMHYEPRMVASFLRLSGGRGLTSRMLNDFRDEARARPHEVEVDYDSLAENFRLFGMQLGQSRTGA
jgi:hypothetical protein